MLARCRFIAFLVAGLFTTTAGVAQEASFSRGNVNADGQIDLSDAICVLSYLFLSDDGQDLCRERILLCPDAADANDDGQLDLSDPVKILLYLFAGTGSLPAPCGECGLDTTEDYLECASYAGCNDSPGGAQITLNGSSITVDGSGVEVYDAIAVIASSGTYTITGTLTDGQIVVAATDDAVVILVLAGVTIHCSDNSPILILTAASTIIVLQQGTVNHLTDGTPYSNVDTNGEPDAALFSKADLFIRGGGSLLVDAVNNDGIKSKDGLTIEGGTITVNSVDDGITGKDFVVVENGDITIDAVGDGLKSTNNADATKGSITIETGSIDITSGADAIQVETNVTINGGEITLLSGGGSSAVLGADATAKGIKAPVSLHIVGGDISVNAADDALHTNGTMTIDGGTFSLSTADEAMYADADIGINGGGISILKSNDAIKCVTLTIGAGTVTIKSTDDGIIGTGAITVQDGTITINAGGDGMRSSNDDATGTGHIDIVDGILNITAGSDGIQAETNVVISGGQFTLTTGGGSNAVIGATATAKGIKGTLNFTTTGGTFSINAADDGLHSNGTMVIGGGEFTVASADDAIHADTSIRIDEGNINITKSYEGIESKSITVNGGTTRLVSSDDGINTSDGSGAMSGNWPFYMNGGYVAMNASGDGLDANGPVTMTGGTLIVHGPTRNDNGALDYNTFKNTGGYVVAAGSSGMAQAPGGTSSTRYAVLINFASTLAANTLCHIQKSDGTSVLTFKCSKTYQSVGFASPLLTNGSTYSVYTGGSCTGTATDGLYDGGTYSGGTLYKTFTITGLVTQVGGGGPPPHG
jgi:hypothetical protein